LMILTLDSPNTTRIFGRTPLEVNVAVSQFISGEVVRHHFGGS